MNVLDIRTSALRRRESSGKLDHDDNRDNDDDDNGDGNGNGNGDGDDVRLGDYNVAMFVQSLDPDRSRTEDRTGLNRTGPNQFRTFALQFPLHYQ